MSETAVETPATEEATTTPPPTATPKPTETLEFWKQKAREQENRAKSNSDAARRLQEIEDAQKTNEQRVAESAAKAQRELETARSDAARYRAAATHRLGEDYFDFLGSGSEDEILDRAQRLGSIVSERDSLKTENEQLKAELDALRQGKPSPTSRPVEALRPGATPSDAVPMDDSYPASWFPQARKQT